MKNNVLKSTFFIFFYFLANAQDSKLAKANKYYKEIAYVDAIKTYERVALKGYKSIELFQKLANSYYFNGKLKEANGWYSMLFSLNQAVDVEYYYRYSQTLKALGQYEKANQYLDKFNSMTPSDKRGKLYIEHKDYKEVIGNNSGRYEVRSAGVNSNVSDYGPAFYGEKIIFSTARDSVSYIKAPSKWTNNAFTNFYSAEKKADGTLRNSKFFSNKINSKFNESTPIFTKDLKTVYFTRNNFNNGKKGYDNNKFILLKLYRATIVNNEWIGVVELPFNSDDYSVAHPALSPDEKTLYFASDMPGTKGQSDIFKVAIFEDGTFGDPVNLGGIINTEGRETFPYITTNNDLYFASDGHPGLGGLDVFVSSLEEVEEGEDVNNIGAPINSQLDDFAFIISFESKKGYFSSNRDGGKGLDDIYFLEEKTPLLIERKFEINGLVSDSETTEFIENAKVTLLDEKFNVLKELTTDVKGKYKFELIAGSKYYIRMEKEGYETKELPVILPNKKGNLELKLSLNKKVKEVSLKADLALILGIKSIVFDSNKADIKKDSEVELAKIVDIMNQHPNFKISIRSHSDSRNSADYNLKLSQKRAFNTMQYLIKSGIESNRLKAEGFGESELLNKCSDGVECSEEEHEKNRRSQFILSEF